MENEPLLITIWKDRLKDLEGLVLILPKNDMDHHRYEGRANELQKCITELSHWHCVLFPKQPT